MPKTYRVVSRTPYKGHPNGEEFTADLDPDEEDRAVSRGAIVVEEQVKPAESRPYGISLRPKKRWDAD